MMAPATPSPFVFLPVPIALCAAMLNQMATMFMAGFVWDQYRTAHRTPTGTLFRCPWLAGVLDFLHWTPFTR